ncbi:Atu1372/SO_1960 family protein [Pseudomonas entomophila]|uniref:Atu1372/SO_1960 family protein n=1 Tax=Pseudomonas entomophila TaxID=312306 RepID=UPI00200C3486|nr:Atu1372/SO_1960 family protein [Pseudomonas entomophila]
MNMLDTPESRLQAVGLTLPSPAPALGNYGPWSIVGNTLMTSGQFPWVDGQLQYRAFSALRRISTGPARGAALRGASPTFR